MSPENTTKKRKPFSAEEIRKICVEAGAGDVGFMDIERESMSSESTCILDVYPPAQSIISLIKVMNPGISKARHTTSQMMSITVWVTNSLASAGRLCAASTKRAFAGKTDLAAAINRGDIILDGNADLFGRFLSSFPS